MSRRRGRACAPPPLRRSLFAAPAAAPAVPHPLSLPPLAPRSYKAQYPSATAAQVKDAILAAARASPLASLASTTITGGKLNIPAMLGVAPPNVCNPTCAAGQYCNAGVCAACTGNW